MWVKVVEGYVYCVICLICRLRDHFSTIKCSGTACISKGGLIINIADRTAVWTFLHFIKSRAGSWSTWVLLERFKRRFDVAISLFWNNPLAPRKQWKLFGLFKLRWPVLRAIGETEYPCSKNIMAEVPLKPLLPKPVFHIPRIQYPLNHMVFLRFDKRIYFHRFGSKMFYDLWLYGWYQEKYVCDWRELNT